jgi:sigma-E processing peptidase SpoIIGA
MYIELYIFDNFLMNYLIVLLSQAILGRRANKWLKVGICLFAAIYALFAYYVPIMNLWVFKIVLCVIMALPFRPRSVRDVLSSVGAVFVSTALIGGATFALVYAFSGDFRGGVLYAPNGMRVLLYSVSVGLMLPIIFRKLAKRRIKASMQVPVRVVHKGNECEFNGIVDTGNLLTEPLSGLPVIVLYSPQLLEFCEVEIPYADISKAGVLKAFLPDKLFIDGIEVIAFVAPTDKDKNMPCLVPVLSIPHKNKGVEKNVDSPAPPLH